MSALVFDEVFATYGPYKALNGLTLTVGEVDSVTVLGRNGAGKSTLARAATGLVSVTSGRIEVLGLDASRTSPHSLARGGVLHLPEGVGLFSGLSIEENLVLRVGGRSAAERKQRLDRAIDSLGPLRDRLKAKAGQLSGGQQRLVAVTGALAAEPRLLLADEPALGLSPAAADDVYGALEQFRAHGAALVVIETRLNRVEPLCPRAVVLDRGAVVYDGSITGARSALEALLEGRGAS
jgi:branched-chain amino acid transport system ATP-binding protein